MKKESIYDYSNYERFPIQLNYGTIMLIHLFKKDTKDIREWGEGTEHENFERTISEISKSAAEQLIKQLKGEWCVSFLQNLIIECLKHIKDYPLDLHIKKTKRIINEFFQEVKTKETL